ncbi:MAG: putative lipid II flippase FtsW [Magnetococcales bacterium]|nr:putative lipid II flippase FtsW [Magnetococcales bacterium]NGZ29110.1 putative lipid II flippase FtsW [Magnetococcales bacterium]
MTMAARKSDTPRSGPDLVIAAIALCLVVLGLVMVYSASSPLALRRFNDPAHFALRNGVYALLGLIIMAALSKMPLETIRKMGTIAFIPALILLFLVLIPGIGHETNGARRWIRLGFLTIQPSEPFKVILILWLANFLAVSPERAMRFKGGIFPLMWLFAIVAALLLAEPDFGSTLMVGTIMMGMIFVAGIPFIWIATLLMMAVPAAAVAVISAPYRLKRVTSFMDPWDDPRNSDFQLVQSLLSFGNGGVSGLGLGEGRQKQFYLPESHTDFILAVIGEELGLIWVVALLLLFALLVWRGLQVARQATDRFACLAATGITVWIGTQAIANAGVVMGLLPPKGLTLPMVSYGGSSLMVTLTAMGLLMAFSRPHDTSKRAMASREAAT